MVYSKISDSQQAGENTNVAIGANLRYEIGHKEQESRIFTAEVSWKQRTLIFAWLLVGLLTTLLVIEGLYLYQRHYYLRCISDAHFSPISGLLWIQQKLRENNEALLRA